MTALACLGLAGSFNVLKNLMDDTDVITTAQLEVRRGATEVC